MNANERLIKLGFEPKVETAKLVKFTHPKTPDIIIVNGETFVQCYSAVENAEHDLRENS